MQEILNELNEKLTEVYDHENNKTNYYLIGDCLDMVEELQNMHQD